MVKVDEVRGWEKLSLTSPTLFPQSLLMENESRQQLVAAVCPAAEWMGKPISMVTEKASHVLLLFNLGSSWLKTSGQCSQFSGEISSLHLIVTTETFDLV